MTGSVRGALSNERPYRDRAFPILLTVQITERAVPTRSAYRVGKIARERFCPPYRFASSPRA
jgi:hypothetical protein